MKNKRFMIMLAIVIILVISGISLVIFFHRDYTSVDVNVTDIMSSISTNLGSDLPPMMDFSDEDVKGIYNIDLSRIEGYAIKSPLMNIRPDEIAIIKVKNMKDIDYIKNAYTNRLREKEKTFDKYLQDQYEIIKDPLIIVKGKYILLSISDKNEYIESIFNSFFKK